VKGRYRGDEGEMKGRYSTSCAMMGLRIWARLSGRSFAARCLLTVMTTGGFSLVHLGGCTGAAASSILPQKCSLVSGKSNSRRLASSAPRVCGRSVYLGRVRIGVPGQG
jgi:hypothetical protein